MDVIHVKNQTTLYKITDGSSRAKIRKVIKCSQEKRFFYIQLYAMRRSTSLGSS